MGKGKTIVKSNRQERAEAIIDEYYSNGYKGSIAVATVTGVKPSGSTAVMFNAIKNNPKNKEYIEAKRTSLMVKADIKNVQVIRELIHWVYSDSAEFIGLTPDEVKQLPSEVRRCIQSFESKKHTYTDRNGKTHTEETIKIKLIDKVKALDILSKQLGYYEANNRQKSSTVNINNLPSATINVLLQAMKEGNTPTQ